MNKLIKIDTTYYVINEAYGIDIDYYEEAKGPFTIYRFDESNPFGIDPFTIRSSQMVQWLGIFEYSQNPVADLLAKMASDMGLECYLCDEAYVRKRFAFCHLVRDGFMYPLYYYGFRHVVAISITAEEFFSHYYNNIEISNFLFKSLYVRDHVIIDAILSLSTEKALRCIEFMRENYRKNILDEKFLLQYLSINSPTTIELKPECYLSRFFCEFLNEDINPFYVNICYFKKKNRFIPWKGSFSSDYKYFYMFYSLHDYDYISVRFPALELVKNIIMGNLILKNNYQYIIDDYFQGMYNLFKHKYRFSTVKKKDFCYMAFYDPNNERDRCKASAILSQILLFNSKVKVKYGNNSKTRSTRKHKEPIGVYL